MLYFLAIGTLDTPRPSPLVVGSAPARRSATMMVHLGPLIRFELINEKRLSSTPGRKLELMASVVSIQKHKMMVEILNLLFLSEL